VTTAPVHQPAPGREKMTTRVMDTVMMLVILVIALRFINRTQLVARVEESRED
jgi:hypothetical protein